MACLARARVNRAHETCCGGGGGGGEGETLKMQDGLQER